MSSSVSTTRLFAATGDVSAPVLSAWRRSTPISRACSDNAARSSFCIQQIARSNAPSATRAACVCDGITQVSTRNCATPAARSTQSVGHQFTHPIRTGSDTAKPVARLRNASAWSMSARASATSAAPAGVRATERRSRSNSCTFRSRSSALICWDSDGPAMRNRCAARPKFSSSATATKYRN
ncbi:hypothetical protein MPSYJ_17290 [Mycolicibacterium psychrotolerans]|uniref:Uncharacterized protein n=1 Tax=Mycolicibacterium psychrotolerans TaxID=216929 RepID=A0A7I7M7S0_9MYCO|nr:hypothetical protein MPSYJ_17290 [Mycolicibacterium psychrotolerans]